MKVEQLPEFEEWLQLQQALQAVTEAQPVVIKALSAAIDRLKPREVKESPYDMCLSADTGEPCVYRIKGIGCIYNKEGRCRGTSVWVLPDNTATAD